MSDHLDDNALLAALRERARTRELEDSALERIVRGEDPGVDVDPTIASLLSPIGDETRARVFARATAGLTKRSSAPRSRPRWIRWVGASVPAFAAAAALVFVVGRSGKAPLPSYQLEASESRRTLRGPNEAPPPPGVVRLGGVASLFLLARPETRPRVPVEAHVFGLRAGAWTEVDATVTVSDEGSASVEIARAALAGVDEVRVVVSERGANSEDLRRRAERGEALDLHIER